jgi:hypothetical protein
MHRLILTDLPWLMSAISLLCIYLSGRKIRLNWLIGLGNQGFWLVYVLTAKSWGMLPLTAGITLLCIKNWYAWAPEGTVPVWRRLGRALAVRVDRLLCRGGFHPMRKATPTGAWAVNMFGMPLLQFRCPRCERRFWRLYPNAKIPGIHP